MNPEDSVLVGVVNRKKDFEILQQQHWYRIPEGKAPKGIYAEVLAFFLSGKVFKEQSGGIHYYARTTGHELASRKDLLPDEAEHKRAEQIYHKIQLEPLRQKIPPITNQPNPYRFAFINTTWDRFITARHVRDLYSQSDYFVDRVFHVLRQHKIKPLRSWEATEITYPITSARLRVLCENGSVVASTNPDDAGDDEDDELIYLNPQDYLSDTDAQASARQILEAVRRRGGPKMIDVPIELY